MFAECCATHMTHILCHTHMNTHMHSTTSPTTMPLSRIHSPTAYVRLDRQKGTTALYCGPGKPGNVHNQVMDMTFFAPSPPTPLWVPRVCPILAPLVWFVGWRWQEEVEVNFLPLETNKFTILQLNQELFSQESICTNHIPITHDVVSVWAHLGSTAR